jgi:ubiquinone biosynthesis protein COQ9
MTTAQTRSSLKENISKNIEAALQKLVQKKKLTIEEQCTQLVYNTLRLVPEQRWNIDQIARELKRILAAT